MSRQKINTAALATPGRLDQPLVVLRKVDIDPLSVRLSPSASTTMEMIGEGHVEQGLQEKELTWFSQGLILNDQPRDAGINDEILQHTLGFAVARTDNAEILKKFGPDGLKAAEAAIGSARFEMRVSDIDLDDSDMPEDFDAEPEA